MLARAWTCAGRASDVEQPGSWIRSSSSGDDILVVRGEDLELRAFYNLCRHRGTPLLDGDSGRAERIACPYHGWSYACTGALRDAPNTPSDFNRGPWGLRAVRVALWQGFVFVTQDEATPPLEAWMGPVPPTLSDAPLALLSRARSVSHEVAAGWKLLVSNFQESHHFPSVHPELERFTPTRRARSLFAKGSKWLGGEMDITGAAETVSKSGFIGARPRIVPGRTVFDAMLFPLLLTSLQPDYFLTYRLEPLARDRTRVIAEIFVHPATPKDADLSDVFDFWDVVNAQDRAICERQQRGLGSRGLSPGPRLPADEGVYAFEALLAEALA